MSQTPNLEITEVSANQNQKEATISTGFVEFDGAIAGLLVKAMSDADYTLTTGEGGEALGNMSFQFTGTLSATRNIIAPNNKKIYFVQNNTTGGHALTFKTSAGTGVSIAVSATAYTIVYCDGVNIVAASSAGAGSLATLSDVLLTSPSNGQQLVYNAGASKWENGAGGVEYLAALLDVLITLPTDGQVLKYNGSASKWENGTAAANNAFSEAVGDGSSTTIVVAHDLGTVNVSVSVYDIATGAEEPATTTYKVIDANNVSVTFAVPPSSVSKKVVVLAAGGNPVDTLAQLLDVLITSPTDGQTLVYNSTAGKWENGTGAGGSNLGNIVAVPKFSSSNTYGSGGYSTFIGLMSRILLRGGNTWKFSINNLGAATLGACVVYRCLKDSAVVFDVTPVSFGSSFSSISLTTGENFCDTISLPIDPTYDYWIVLHWTSGGLMSNFVTQANVPMPQGGYGSAATDDTTYIAGQSLPIPSTPFEVVLSQALVLS